MTSQINEGRYFGRPCADLLPGYLLPPYTMLVIRQIRSDNLRARIKAHNLQPNGRRPTRLDLMLMPEQSHSCSTSSIVQMPANEHSE